MKHSKTKTFLFILKKFNQLEPRYIWFQLANSILTILITFWYVFFPPLVLKLLLGYKNSGYVITVIAAACFGFFVLRVIAEWLSAKLQVMTFYLDSELHRDIGNQIMNCEFSMIEDAAFVALKEKAMFPLETQDVCNRLFQSIPTLFQAIFVLVGVFSIVLYYNVWLVVVVLAVTLVNFLISYVYIKKEAAEALGSASENSRYVYYLRIIRDERIAKDVRIYQAQPFIIEKVKTVFDHFIRTSKELYNSRDMRGIINRFISIALMIFAYSYILMISIQSGLDGSSFLLIINATLSFSDQIYIILNEYLVLNQQLIYLEPYMELQHEIKINEHHEGIYLDEPITRIEFRDVYFSYPKTDHMILNGLSFVLDNHQSMSVVGLNGSGKTTMIKLLSKLYIPDAGEILINNIPLTALDTDSYLNQLSVIFQDFKTFHYSLKENIVFDQPFDESLLNQAVGEAEFTRDAQAFIHGLDSKINKDFDSEGISLSKGQEQKLVIARAIYKTGSLMILDEPTASLDPIAEEEVYRHFEEVAADKLAIFISHRLSSCRFSQIILFLKDGVVSESGSHEQLMNERGDYAELFTIQASHYQDN